MKLFQSSNWKQSLTGKLETRDSIQLPTSSTKQIKYGKWFVLSAISLTDLKLKWLFRDFWNNLSFQAGVYKSEKPLADATKHRIRITLTSQNVKSLEKGTLKLLNISPKCFSRYTDGFSLQPAHRRS